MSSRGELVGRSLRLAGARYGPLTVELPAESFVGRRSGDAVVYTRSGGGKSSEVHVVDVATGCDTIVARPGNIVRSAIIGPDASTIYVHSVARGTRRDAGVTRHDLATGAQTTVVPALEASRRLGRIHGTELRWSVDGSALTVHSCGFAECVARVLDVASGQLTTIDETGIGALIGTTDRKLVTYAACPGLPCSVLAHDLESGAPDVVADEAFEAQLSSQVDGRALLTIQTSAGTMEVEL